MPTLRNVAAVEINDIFAAYPFSVLHEVGVANDLVSGVPIVVFWMSRTASPLSPSALDVGSSAVFLRTLGDQVLTFRALAD